MTKTLSYINKISSGTGGQFDKGGRDLFTCQITRDLDLNEFRLLVYT
jgi:hypothetical protein